MATANKSFFWEGLENRIEADVKKALSRKTEVRGMNACFRLVLLPLPGFLAHYLFSGNILKGRQGFREAVHKAVLDWAVNARLYEIQNGDTAELDRIKNEWNRSKETR